MALAAARLPLPVEDARSRTAADAQAAHDSSPQASSGSCQGVRTRGPSAVIAIVNSKCAASEPSCVKIDQWSSAIRT